MRPIWGPSGSFRPQMSPLLATRILLSGLLSESYKWVRSDSSSVCLSIRKKIHLRFLIRRYGDHIAIYIQKHTYRCCHFAPMREMKLLVIMSFFRFPWALTLSPAIIVRVVTCWVWPALVISVPNDACICMSDIIHGVVRHIIANRWYSHKLNLLRLKCDNSIDCW